MQMFGSWLEPQLSGVIQNMLLKSAINRDKRIMVAAECAELLQKRADVQWACATHQHKLQHT